AGIDQHGDEHADAGQHHGADDLVELEDPEDRPLHRPLRARARPCCPSISTCSASTNCAACAARLAVIHSTAAPRSRAAEIACAMGTASSEVCSNAGSCNTIRSGEPRKPRTQAART